MEENKLDNKTVECGSIDNKKSGCEFSNNCNDAMKNNDCNKYFVNCAKYEVWKNQGGC